MRSRIACAGFLCLSLVAACGQQPSTASLKERWNWQNDPQRMDADFIDQNRYIARFDKNVLPLVGKLTRQPWSGDYWPTYRGGISYRWNDRGNENERRGYELLPTHSISSARARYLSPAEKFDLLIGRTDYPFTQAERQRTRVLKSIKGHPEYVEGFTIPYWEGLCHAWAPATLAFREPRPVDFEVPYGPHKGLKIPFGSSDIKALLTYFVHENPGRTKFLGSRCNVKLDDLERDYREGKISSYYYYEQRQACLDTNAGAFHIVLANQIGRMNEGFIADVTKEDEVWNQAVYGYETKILEEHEGASEGAAEGTVREVIVETRMDYTFEIYHSWETPGYLPKTSKTYTYRLELNSDGDIIGGAWPDHETDRPDFLWKSEIPDFYGVWNFLAVLYEKSIAETDSNHSS